jgi:hypothetical protein
VDNHFLTRGQKLETDPTHHPVHFKPYRVSIIRLYCSAMGRNRTEDSILSGGNGIETCFESLVQRFSSKLLLKGSSMSVRSRLLSTDVIALN